DRRIVGWVLQAGKGEWIELPDLIGLPDAPIAVSLEDAARDLGGQRQFARFRRRSGAEVQHMTGAQGGKLLRREPKVHLDRTPPPAGERLQQLLLGGRGPPCVVGR